VDFKVQGPLQEVLAYLRTRKEVNGINSYRNNLIHIDFNERQSVAGAGPAGQRRPWPAPAQAQEEAPSRPPPKIPSPPPARSPRPRLARAVTSPKPRF
jgi:hypothetical protein